MDKDIIKSIENNDMNNLLKTTYSNLKRLNELCNNYIKNCTDVKNNDDCTMDITTVYSAKLLHTFLNKYKGGKTQLNEISLFRQIVLNLLEQFVENKVYVKDEFANDTRVNTSYHLIVCDNERKIKLFILYLLIYRIESFVRVHNYKDKRRRAFVGIDYEFVKREIALMQINFENIKTQNKMINYMFIINPIELDPVQMNLLTRKLMENKYIFKIFHGADSLDMPYTLNEMLKNDTNSIKKFMKKFVDTRFLCEYLKGSIDSNKKCTIYEALNYFGTISNDKLDYLNKTHDAMGPIQNISWDIHRLSKFHRKYAFYDVIYLPKLFTDIYKMAYEKTPNSYKFYRYLNEITRFIMKEKRGITTITSEIKLEVDEINNNIIKVNDNNVTFIMIFNQIVDNIQIKSIEFNSALLLNINYFKSTMVLLLKKIIYHILSTDYDVYINKKNSQQKIIQLDDLYSKLEKHNYDKIYHIVKLLYPEIKLMIQNTLKKI